MSDRVDAKKAAELLAAATPGPWTRYCNHYISRGGKVTGFSAYNGHPDLSANDAALIAAAPDLATAVIALTEERDMARDCGQSGVCALSPGCHRHWEERNRELVAERDMARDEAECWALRVKRRNEEIAKLTEERDAARHALDRWQTGTQIEGDYVRANGEVVRDPRAERDVAIAERDSVKESEAVTYAILAAARERIGVLTALRDTWLQQCAGFAAEAQPVEEEFARAAAAAVKACARELSAVLAETP